MDTIFHRSNLDWSPTPKIWTSLANDIVLCTFVSTLGQRLFVMQNTLTKSTFIPWKIHIHSPLLTSFLGATSSFTQIVDMLSKTLFQMHCSFGYMPNLSLISSQYLNPPSSELHKSLIVFSPSQWISCAFKINNPNLPPLKEVPYQKLTFLMDVPTIMG